MTVLAFLSPPALFKAFDNNGVPLFGGQLFTYAAGTTTPIATWTDWTATTPNTNPIILNSRGEASVYLLPNVAYKFTLQDASGNNIWTVDQILNNQLLTLYGGTDTGGPNVYILNFTASFSSLANGIVLYWIPSNTNTGASTLNVNGLGTVPIVNPDGSALGANQIITNQITSVVYSNGNWVLQSVTGFTGPIVGTFGPESALASAATTDLGTATAHVVLVTGTTTITSFGSSANTVAPIYIVRFASALILTQSTTLLLPGGANITTSPGDALIAEYLGAGTWKVLIYQFGSGNAQTKIKPGDTARLSTTTMTADPDLVSNPLAVGRYTWEALLVFDSVASAAGFKWSNIGTAVDSRGIAPALASGIVNAAAYGPISESPYGTTITYANVSTSANSNIVLYKGSLLVSTAGTFGVEWAQGTSTASNTTLRAGSYLTTSLASTGASNTGVTRSYSSGTGTETIPATVSTLVIECWSGGSGGGGGVGSFSGNTASGGGGGSGGSYCRSSFALSGNAGQTMTYTVGAAGTPAVGGGTSTVVAGTFSMTTMTANGGNPGANATAFMSPGAGGTGGTAVGGTVVNTTGVSGGPGGNNQVTGGHGGNGITGISGSGARGGGGNYQSGAGNSGGAGLIIFTYS